MTRLTPVEHTHILSALSAAHGFDYLPHDSLDPLTPAEAYHFFQDIMEGRGLAWQAEYPPPTATDADYATLEGAADSIECNCSYSASPKSESQCGGDCCHAELVAMMKRIERTKTIRVKGAAAAKHFAAELLSASKWFQLEPLPDDEYEFRVKDEAGIPEPSKPHVTDEIYRNLAREDYGRGDDDCEIDSDATVSHSDEGAFVAAWVWVRKTEMQEQWMQDVVELLQARGIPAAYDHPGFVSVGDGAFAIDDGEWVGNTQEELTRHAAVTIELDFTDPVAAIADWYTARTKTQEAPDGK